MITSVDAHNSKKSSGGGVLIAVKSNLSAQLIDDNSWCDLELVWTRIDLGDRKLYVCVLYLPPDRSRDVALAESFSRCISKVSSSCAPEDDILVIGDFNMPGLKWCSNHGSFLYPDPARSTFSTPSNIILDYLSTATLRQINSVVNENGRMLDLCFANDGSRIPTIELAPAPLVKAVPHHPALSASLEVTKLNARVVNLPAFHLDYKKANFDDISRILATIDWASELDLSDPNSAAETFSHILNYIIDRHVPKRTIRENLRTPWVTTELRRLKTEIDVRFEIITNKNLLTPSIYIGSLIRLIKKPANVVTRTTFAEYNVTSNPAQNHFGNTFHIRIASLGEFSRVFKCPDLRELLKVSVIPSSESGYLCRSDGNNGVLCHDNSFLPKADQRRTTWLEQSIYTVKNIVPKSAKIIYPLEISYLVLSQPTLYHSQRANKLRSSILKQQSDIVKLNEQQSAITTGSQPPNVHLSHELFEDHEGSWAITPILRRLRASILRTTSFQTRWLIICEENSHVNVSLLVHHLAKEDYRQDLFLGYPLYDREATIIHHFAFFKNPSSFLYPYLRAGIALSIPLVDHLCQLLSAAGTKLTEFFIDAGHEFALLVWNGGTGQPLSSRSFFCAHRRPSQGCAIMAGAALMEPGRPTKEEFETASSCSIVSRTKSTSNRSIRPFGQGSIIFAVKTCQKFHEDRVPVLLNTWAKYVQHLRLYSDISDASIPTVGIPIPNTSAGHCAKTLEIIRLIGEEISQNASLSDVKWIMLVDDDTILSPSALLRYLGNFNPNQDLYIGERYGYHLVSREDYLDPDESGRHRHHHHHHQGYNYITGGGGIIIGVKILDALLRWCECPSASSPDDMILAACLFQLGVRPIHSPLFHQARPSDYAPEVLAADRPAIVSFHKHWQIDPYQVR
ncbi:uncharacterized protein LOC129741554 [Uranotaenia lowii]|uniref:uncharacterized protein LOC129741554 n=1 Tax=Uranotaenia lowii TaxID=190385 RepID=UPI00247A742C|nr:uncharacterized protein LOC129741554 [Uranotaenia lowii]